MDTCNDSSTGLLARRRRPLPWGHGVLLLLLLAGAATSLYSLLQLRQRFVFESFPVQVRGAATVPVERVYLKGRGSYPAHFLLLHGYVANRSQLRHLAEVLAATGADVYVPDLPGRGDHTGAVSPRPLTGPTATMPTERETQAALAVVERMEREFGVGLDRLVVVGHSMGGGVALDVGRHRRPAATVSLAGLERPVAPGNPAHLLLLTARLEIPALRRAADRMYERVQGSNASGRLEFLAIHSSLPFHSPVQRAIVEWTNRAVPGARLTIPANFNESLLALTGATLFFLLMLFVPLSGLAGWGLAAEPFAEVVPETRLSLWSSWHLGGYALLAGAAAVSLIALLEWFEWTHPLSFLRLADGDYLASVLLLATLWLLPALRNRPWVRSGRETAARVGVALALAAYLVLVVGGFLTWQLYDIWPTPARLARALLLMLILFPYALGEELLVRTCSKQAGSSALSVRLLWRLGLLGAILYGAAALASGAGMLLLLTFPLMLLSLVQHFFSTVLYRWLGSAYAGAVFNVVLLVWFLATVFPLR